MLRHGTYSESSQCNHTTFNPWLLDKICYTSKCDSTMTALIICAKEFNDDVGIPVTSYGPQECLSFWLSSWKFSLDCWFTQNWTGFITEKCILQTVHLPLFWNTDFKLSDNIHNTENKCIYIMSHAEFFHESSWYYFGITVEIERICRSRLVTTTPI